jgi:hypothetical protein
VLVARGSQAQVHVAEKQVHGSDLVVKVCSAVVDTSTSSSRCIVLTCRHYSSENILIHEFGHTVMNGE